MMGEENRKKSKIAVVGICFSIIGIILFIVGIVFARISYVGNYDIVCILLGFSLLCIGLILGIISSRGKSVDKSVNLRHKSVGKSAILIPLIFCGSVFIVFIFMSFVLNNYHYDNSRDSICFQVVKNGKWVSYYPNGNILLEGNCKDGLEDGQRIGYYENGGIKERFSMENGNKNGERVSYYPNGNIAVEGNYKDGEKDGEYIYYYDNGGIKNEQSYKNGSLDGKQVSYFTNGKVKDQGNVIKGKKDGKRVFYYENGNIEYEEYYKNGEKIRNGFDIMRMNQ